MEQVFHIIKYKLISFMKINTDLKPVNILKNLGSAVVYILFGIGVYFFTKSSLAYLLEEIRIGTFLLHRFVSIILFIFFMIYCFFKFDSCSWPFGAGKRSV